MDDETKRTQLQEFFAALPESERVRLLTAFAEGIFDPAPRCECGCADTDHFKFSGSCRRCPGCSRFQPPETAAVA